MKNRFFLLGVFALSFGSIACKSLPGTHTPISSGNPWDYLVSTVAGSGPGAFGNEVNHFADGAGNIAKFQFPMGIAVDTSGNQYITDLYNHCIRKITASGIVTTIAGNGTPGYLDGTGTGAQFNNLHGITVDSSGNLFVTEDLGNRIRKITPAGVVSTLAGNGTAGYADAIGTSAQFSSPGGIAVDTGGNLFVSDTGNNRIRKITPAGVVSTLAGNGTAGYADAIGTSAQFNYPQGIAVDTGGNLFVSDRTGNRIRKITPTGIVSTIAGNGTFGSADGDGTNARFYLPEGIAVDTEGNLFVSDTASNRIRKITPAGFVSTIAGNGTSGYFDGSGSSALFSYPNGIAVGANGNLFVADSFNNCIRKIQKK